jgi:hypothetical protein
MDLSTGGMMIQSDIRGHILHARSKKRSDVRMNEMFMEWSIALKNNNPIFL